MEEFFIRHNTELKDLFRYGVLRAEELKNPSLYDGKLGMAIIFYEYSRYRGDMLFEELADEIMDSLLILPSTLPFGLGDGLSGIGWGISYLFRERFVGGDINCVLSDIDDKLKAKIMQNQDDALYRDYSLYLDMRNSLIEKKQTNKEEYILKEIWHSCLCSND